MKFFRTTLIALIFACSITQANASHMVGGDLTYCCTGPDTYEVTVNFFRDCNGIIAPTFVTVQASSTCGNTSATLQLQNIGGTEISQLCAQDIQNSTCNNGSLPGFELYTYSGPITLTPCADWFISYSICCRALSGNLQTAPIFYMDAFLNSILDSCNSTPVFNDMRVPYFCVNQPALYDFGVVQGTCGTECGADSLSFSLVPAQSALLTPVIYNFPYTGSEPITGITIDPQTGKLSFIPTQMGKFVVAVRVSEWKNNNLIGTITRDVVFEILNCNNQVPDGNVPISNLTGSATQLNSTTLAICSGDQFCFDISVSDPDNNQTVTLTSNIATVLPGATFTTTPGNPATATICWEAGDCCASWKAFTVIAIDDACPVTGVAISTFGVSVLESTYAGPDHYICAGNSAQMNVCGGTQFQWVAISGDTIDVGNNFTCDTCANPIASPTVTTTYVVTSNFTGGCDNVDTVTVFINNPDPGPINGLTTVNEFVTEVYSVVQSTGSSYQWFVSGGILLNGQWTNSITVQWGGPGTGNVCVEETDSAGCISDTICIQVNINPSGVEELLLSNEVMVHPNPFSSTTTITWNANPFTTYIVELLDLSGRVVQKLTIISVGRAILSRKDLASGVYMIRLTGKNIIHKKVIIE